MGLDLLDVQFRIEKTFGLKLTQEEITGLVRDRDIVVGDFYDLLLRKLQLRDVARHDLRLNFRLWVEIQRILHSVTDLPLEQIELGTSLECLFPRQTRRNAWAALCHACPYRVRELDYPIAVRVIGFCLATSVVLIESFRIWKIPGVNWLWPLLGLIGLWMVSETYLKILWMCAPLRKTFPSRIITVKDLCREILAVSYGEVSTSAEIPLDERCVAVWKKLTETLADTLGVDTAEVTFRSKLFSDLAME